MKGSKIAILAIFSVILLTSFGIASDLQIYGGECKVLKYKEGEINNYKIESNSTNLKQLNDTLISNDELEVCADQSMKPDNFTINFNLDKPESSSEDDTITSGGGGGFYEAEGSNNESNKTNQEEKNSGKNQTDQKEEIEDKGTSPKEQGQKISLGEFILILAVLGLIGLVINKRKKIKAYLKKLKERNNKNGKEGNR